MTITGIPLNILRPFSPIEPPQRMLLARPSQYICHPERVPHCQLSHGERRNRTGCVPKSRWVQSVARSQCCPFEYDSECSMEHRILCLGASCWGSCDLHLVTAFICC